ncbi:M24 family metallopeptidase [Bradyrhizobium sp. B120]|uniref:M24 family metallopeptidase n=1 Tax=Bradyrhizobium sp. B120 TaxID=3410088 RepID=UPI003B980A26
MAPAFPVVEYRERLTKLRQQMNDRGLSLLVVSNPANMNYISGYDALSYQNPQALLLPGGDLEPVWIGRGLDTAGAEASTWLSVGNIVGYVDAYADNSQKAMEIVANEIKKRGWNRGRVGYEGDAFYFTPRACFSLQKNIPEVEWVDVGFMINWIKTTKTPREIEFMRRAGKIAENVMNVAIDSLTPGMRESDFAARIVQAQVEGAGEFGGSLPAAGPFVLTGKHAGLAHSPWTTDIIPHGSSTTVELAGCYLGYHSAIARTISLSEPSAGLARLANAVLEGWEAARAATRPGATCHDVWAAWQRVLERSGYKKLSRIGYSIGLAYPPTWREYTLSFERGNEVELRQGMCFHLLCGMWTGDGTNNGEPTYSISESVRVTENGVEALANVERELFVKQ